MTEQPTNILPTNPQVTPPDMTQLLYMLNLQIKKEINCVRVGTVQSWDPAKNTVIVNISQQQVLSTNPQGVQTIRSYPLLVNVPVAFQGGGGYTLTFPIAPGDECIILFNDRELDNWQINGPGYAPTSARLHDLSDGIAIVGIRNQNRALSSVSTSMVCLRSDDNTLNVELDHTGGIATITAPQQINLNAPIVAIQGVIDVLNINAIANSCNITGNIVTDGEVTSTLGGIHTLTQHIHGGVENGIGDTDPPID